MQHLSWTGTLGAYLNPLFLTGARLFSDLGGCCHRAGLFPTRRWAAFDQPHPTLHVPDGPKPSDWTGALAVEPRGDLPARPSGHG